MDEEEQKSQARPVIFDTDILIHHFRGNLRATEFVRSVPYRCRKVPIIVWMELLQGARSKKDLRIIEKFIGANFSEVLPLTEIIGLRALRLLELHARSSGLRVMEALIAATALIHGYRLATANERDYRSISGLDLLRSRI